MNEELREQILQVIREELSLEVDSDDVYTGGFDGPMYKTCHTLKLMLGNECIASTCLD